MSEVVPFARLLADPDPGIAASLRRHLVERSEDPPGLREAIEAIQDPVERGRARDARLEAGRDRAAERLVSIGNDTRTEPDLQEGAFEVARLDDPDVAVGPARAILDELARSAGPRLSGRAHPARERLLALARFLGHERGFDGDRSEELMPLNSSLPVVLDRKRGLPIALSVVYLLVARRCGIDLYGVGAPLHFLVGGPAGGRPLYLDPFGKGRPLEPEEASQFLRSMGVVFRPEHLAPTGTRAILARMARNLVAFHARRPRGEGRARRYARVATALEAQPSS